MLLSVTVFTVAAMTCAVATTSCSPRSDREKVLDDFSETVRIAPTDSLDLEQFDIFVPDKVIPYGDWYIVGLFSGNNIVDIINPSTQETIHCFRRGRGPGEILNTGPIQESDGCLFVFDISKQTYYALDVYETVKSRRQILKNILNLHDEDDEKYKNEPLFHTFRHKDLIIATGLFNDGTWIRLVNDNGSVLDGIPLVYFKSTDELSIPQRAAFQLSSFISVRPDDKRGICAMLDCGTFSIFDIDSTCLKERIRKIYYEPKLYPPPGEMISPAHDRSNVRGFFDVASSDDSIYLLYSGRTREKQAELDSECSHLLVYDWDGNPVRRYELEKTINSIYLHKGRIYGTSMHPESRIYVYNLPEQC